jgi:hypothetical protein
VLPPEQVESDKVIEFFGMQYAVPMAENLSGTVIAIVPTSFAKNQGRNTSSRT